VESWPKIWDWARRKSKFGKHLFVALTFLDLGIRTNVQSSRKLRKVRTASMTKILTSPVRATTISKHRLITFYIKNSAVNHPKRHNLINFRQCQILQRSICNNGSSIHTQTSSLMITNRPNFVLISSVNFQFACPFKMPNHNLTVSFNNNIYLE
jgi:hypothetical protein